MTPTVTLSKNGGSFASCAGTVTEIASGWYKVAGNATDTNTLGPLILHATGTGADPVDVVFEVVAFDPQIAYAVASDVPSAATNASALLGTTNGAATVAAQLANLDVAVSEGGGQGSSVTVYTAASYAGSTPLNDSEPITLYRGCADTIDPPSLEGYAGGIENGDEVVLRIVAKDVYEDISEDDDVPALVEATTTASLVDGTLTLSWDLTAEQTGALPAGADGSGRTVYKVIAGKDGERPVLDRDCVVFRFPAAPV
mgnify:CR=1 FL=1